MSTQIPGQGYGAVNNNNNNNNKNHINGDSDLNFDEMVLLAEKALAELETEEINHTKKKKKVDKDHVIQKTVQPFYTASIDDNIPGVNINSKISDTRYEALHELIKRIKDRQLPNL